MALRAVGGILLGALGFAGGPAAADAHAGAGWRYHLDLRDLPADSRPAELRVALDGGVAVRAGVNPILTLAVNGVVLARRRAASRGETILNAPIEDRLLAALNTIEVSATAPDCVGWRCPAALATVRVLRPPRFRLEPAASLSTDFFQLITRFRSGIALDAATPAERRLAEVARRALAPRAPDRPSAGAQIHVGKAPPPGTAPPLRFDLGPVRLVRQDGVELFGDRELRRLTVVQTLRTGERPRIWVRPGDDGAIPPEMQLDEGNVALFDGAGRVMNFSTKRDRVVRIAYPAGVDPDGNGRALDLWRLGLLAFWLMATVFLAIVFRRLPRPRASGAA